MKKKIFLAILILIIVMVAWTVFKYFYVPSGQMWHMKYQNLKQVELNGNTTVKVEELKDMSLHIRLGFVNTNDFITYQFDIQNDGTIPAKLVKDPFLFGLDSLTKKYVLTDIRNSDGSEIKTGDVINPGETKTITFKIIYSAAADIPTQDSQNYEVTLYLL